MPIIKNIIKRIRIGNHLFESNEHLFAAHLLEPNTK